MKKSITSILLLLSLLICSILPVLAVSGDGAGDNDSSSGGNTSDNRSLAGYMGQGLRFYMVDKDGNVVSSVYDMLSEKSLTGSTDLLYNPDDIPVEHTFIGTKLGNSVNTTLVDMYLCDFVGSYEFVMNNLGYYNPPISFTGTNLETGAYGTYHQNGLDIRNIFEMDGNYASASKPLQNLIGSIIDDYSIGRFLIHVEGASNSSGNLPSNIAAQKGYTIHVEMILWAKIQPTSGSWSDVNWVYGTVTEIGQYMKDLGKPSGSLACHSALTSVITALITEYSHTYGSTTITNPATNMAIGGGVGYFYGMANKNSGHALHVWSSEAWDEGDPLTSSTYIDVEYRSSSTTPTGNPVTTPDISPHPVADKVYIDPDPANSVEYTTEEAEEIYYTDITDKTTATGDTSIVKMYFSITDDKYLDTDYLDTQNIHYGGGVFIGPVLERMKLDEIYVRADATSNIKVEPEPETGYTLMAYLYCNTIDGTEP